MGGPYEAVAGFGGERVVGDGRPRLVADTARQAEVRALHEVHVPVPPPPPRPGVPVIGQPANGRRALLQAPGVGESVTGGDVRAARLVAVPEPFAAAGGQ